MENTEVYISSIVYNSQFWLDDPDSLVQQVYNNLSEIQGMHFASISLNMGQVYNVSLKQSNYDSMMMYLKQVRYRGLEFFSLVDVQALVIKIKEQLEFIQGLSFGEVEVRTSKSYSDKELGLV